MRAAVQWGECPGQDSGATAGQLPVLGQPRSGTSPLSTGQDLKPHYSTVNKSRLSPLWPQNHPQPLIRGDFLRHSDESRTTLTRRADVQVSGVCAGWETVKLSFQERR